MADINSTQEEKETSKSVSKEKNTGMAILAYILFFIPLLTDSKNDPYVKYHIKQGLVLFIGGILIWIIGTIIPWGLHIITQLLDLGLFILMVLGIINASKGEKKPLPLIGQFGEQLKI